MCCRLSLNQTELINRPGSMWGPGDNTGSLGVVTINLNRLAYEAKTKEEFFEKLGHYMTLSKESLEIKRRIVEKNLANGLMPYTKVYLGTFNNHFSTLGLCGMNEACLNFLGKDIGTEEGKEFTVDTLNFMREKLKEFQKETGSLYNLEATPAESTAYRLAKLDKEHHPDIITAGEKEPYLTNSTHLPVNKTDDVIEALEHQNEIQPLYTGGTIFHTFLGEALSSGESAKELVKKIAFNTKLPYFSITPTFSICKSHGYLKGEEPKCPECGEETEVYSRIVGYFRPVRNWNDGKKEEFKDRLEYVEEKAIKNEFETKVVVRTNGTQESATVSSYKIFTLPTCDKCAEAKKYLNDFSIVGEHFDLASKEGMNVFREYYKELNGVIKFVDIFAARIAMHQRTPQTLKPNVLSRGLTIWIPRVVSELVLAAGNRLCARTCHCYADMWFRTPHWP